MLSRERIAAERLVFRALSVLVLFLCLTWLVPQIWDKLSPFLIAIPIAAALQPVIRFFHHRLKIRRGVTSLILVLLLLALTILVLNWLVGLLIETAVQIVDESNGENLITTTVESIRGAIESLKETITWKELGPSMQDEINNAVNSLTAGITRSGFDIARRFLSLVTNLPYFIIYISFLAMGLFFISRDYDDIRSYLPGGKRRRQDSSTTRLTNSAIRSLIGYLRVQGTFSIMVLVVSLIYLHICGFAYAGTISMLAAVLELIPMIGSGLLYILMGIILLLTGDTAVGIQILLLTGLLQLARRMLEPKLMSNSMKITPLESLIGMFAGLRFGGIAGLIGGPVLMSVLVGAVRGSAWSSLKDDIHCLHQYFRRRWAIRSAEKAETPEGEAPAVPAPPAETPADTPPKQ